MVIGAKWQKEIEDVFDDIKYEKFSDEEAYEAIIKIYDDEVSGITLDLFDLIEEAKEENKINDVIADTITEHVKDKFTGAYPYW